MNWLKGSFVKKFTFVKEAINWFNETEARNPVHRFREVRGTCSLPRSNFFHFHAVFGKNLAK